MWGSCTSAPRTDLSLLGELKSVAQQIHQDLAQADRVRVKNGEMIGNIEQQFNVLLFIGGSLFEGLIHLLQQGPRGETGSKQRSNSPISARDVSNRSLIRRIRCSPLS